MVQIKYTVTPPAPNTVISYEADSRDLYVWEKTDRTQQRTLKTLLERMSMQDLVHVGWIAAKRLALTSLSLDEFGGQCIVDFDLDDDEMVEPDPTSAAPSAATSSNWPSTQESAPMFGQQPGLVE
jgi:hypothetical protein